MVSDSLWPHELQHTRLPCPSSPPSPRVCSNACLLNQWCHPTISSSAILFSFCLQSFPATGSFPMSHLLTSGGQSVAASATSSILSMSIQCWFPFRLTGLISLQSKGLSRAFSSTTIQNDFCSLFKCSFFILSFLYGPTLTSIHDYWKNHSLASFD